MNFLGKAWRILVGIKDALVLAIMLFFFAGLYALLTATPNAAAVNAGALHVALDGVVVEQPERSSPQELLLSSTERVREYRLRDLVHALETAATDNRIKVVALDLDGFWGGGQVALQSVGNALDAVRKAGKPVIAFGTGYSDDSYILAAHASEIWLDPMGATILAGPGGSSPYFKGLIDRLGINVNVYRVGKFKSFVEPFTRTDKSPEARAADQQLADALLENWTSDLKAARPKAQISQYMRNPERMAESPSMAEAALKSGLVDKLGDRIAWSNRIAEIAGRTQGDTADSFNGTDLADYVAANPLPSNGDIGVVTIAGNIVDGEAPAGTAGGETIARIILDALEQRPLKALVVRVDSPGGSAIASERMRQAILQAKLRNKIPVVVSMGNVAASGGYWVAMAGDKVLAEPSTITGSIGVFGLLPTFEKSLSKIGVTADGVRTTPLSGQPDILMGTNAATDALLQSGVNDIYRRFTTLVAKERKLPLSRVDAIAQGRVWDGGTARQIGLVDAFGSLDDAIKEAARLAKLDPEKAEPVYLDHMPNWFEIYMRNLQDTSARASYPSDAYSRMIMRQQAAFATGVADGLAILNGPAVQVRCLSCPAVPRIENRQSAIRSFFKEIF